MNVNAYCIISETTEDRFDEAGSLEEAIRIARALARESQAGDPVSIEHRGRVIRQLVLMPDGRVWTAGSNRDGKQSFRDTLTASDADQPGIDNRELRIEIYSPPYLFRGPRPAIEVAPDTLALPGTFEIGTPDSADIQRVALLRCGSSTHAFDSDQRHVGLAIRSRTDTTLTLEAPPDSNIAPPGYYMLFMLSSSGVPSTGRFIRVT